MLVREPRRLHRSPATAVAITLLLHAGLAAWLLSIGFERQRDRPDEPQSRWIIPLPEPLPEIPPVVERSPPPIVEPEPITPLPVPAPQEVVPQIPPDWYATGRAVAREMAGGPERRTFAERPEEHDERPKTETHSIFEKPLPRVGTTVTTPEGETILWVSDRCYISLGTKSLTLDHIHKGRAGVRICQMVQFGGKKKARDDLLEPIKRLPKKLPEPRQDQQESGCGPGDESQSCPP